MKKANNTKQGKRFDSTQINKLTKDQKQLYITICELTWGCIPFDVEWATNTDIYQRKLREYTK